tara:strand:- start:368 stop:523 length:156 start_codon:yes stop_codon:yes gene_type:complete
MKEFDINKIDPPNYIFKKKKKKKAVTIEFQKFMDLLVPKDFLKSYFKKSKE